MKRKTKSRIGLFFIYVIVYALAITWLYPYVWLLINAFKNTSNIFSTSLFSGPFTTENFTFLVESAEKMHRPFMLAVGNSLFVTIIVTVCTLFFAVIVGYALTKFDFVGRKFLQGFTIFQMMFPPFLLMVPLFILMRTAYLNNTYSSMFLPYIMSAYAIFLAVQSFRNTPDDYVEAARIDGAGEIWIAFKVVAPLNKAILAIIGIITFNSIWDNFIWPLIVVQDVNKMPFSVLIATFSKTYNNFTGPILAGALIQTLPMMIIFLVFRKQFMDGMNISLK
jgi:multiple sugar transport system permease protein